MTRRSMAGDRRRAISSRCGCCAPASLVFVLLALAPAICGAQDLRLQPADAPNASGAAAALDTAEEQMPLPPSAEEAAMSGPDADTELPVPPTTTGPNITKDLTEALNQRGSLTLRNTTLHQALFMISEQWGINIVAGEVHGTVNGVFRNAPLREILDSILLSNGYNYRTVGESLVVSSVKDLGQINPFFQSATIPVHAAHIDEVVEGARLLTTPGGQVTPIKSARAIVVLDFPDRVKMIRDFVASLDSSTGGVGGLTGPGQPMEVGYFRTQHISVKSAEDALQAVLSKEGRVAIMEKDDKLIVSDYPANLAMVESVLERIDRPRPQVRITALIYDISRTSRSWASIGGKSPTLRETRTSRSASIPSLAPRGPIQWRRPGRRCRSARWCRTLTSTRWPTRCGTQTTPGCSPIRASPCSRTKRRSSRAWPRFRTSN
jgi:hypothetical protein